MASARKGVAGDESSDLANPSTSSLSSSSYSSPSSSSSSFSSFSAGGLTSLTSLSGSNVTHRLADVGRSIFASFTSAPVDSSFLAKGTLTPQEFVNAGDLLTHKFPTWQWQGCGKAGKRPSSWLPADKQFLITRSVPCYRRVRDMDNALNSRVGHDAEGGWMLPLLGDEEAEGRDGDGGDAPDLAQSMQSLRIKPAGGEKEAAGHSGDAPSAHTRSTQPGKPNASNAGRSARDDVPDLMSFADIDDLVQEEHDPAAADSPSYFVRNAPDAEIVAARTYDLSITYDKYFQTPRIWLFGYSENGVPLTPEEIFEDILTDYAAKTVTVDPHPCTGIPTASIHPCRHASVMKKVADSWVERGMKPRHDLALLVLLKFISSVIPTIEYDFTMDIDMFIPHTGKEKVAK